MNISELKTMKKSAQIEILKSKNLTAEEIKSITGFSLDSIRGCISRINKRNREYNSRTIEEKYATNKLFLDDLGIKSVLDLYAGEKSFYTCRVGTVVSNDINPNYKKYNTYCEDATALLCKEYAKGNSYDLVDIDCYGFGLHNIGIAACVANKGIIVTYGDINTGKQFGTKGVLLRHNVLDKGEINVEKCVRDTIYVANMAGVSLYLEYLVRITGSNNHRAYFSIESKSVKRKHTGRKSSVVEVKKKVSKPRVFKDTIVAKYLKLKSEKDLEGVFKEIKKKRKEGYSWKSIATDCGYKAPSSLLYVLKEYMPEEFSKLGIQKKVKRVERQKVNIRDYKITDFVLKQIINRRINRSSSWHDIVKELGGGRSRTTLLVAIRERFPEEYKKMMRAYTPAIKRDNIDPRKLAKKIIMEKNKEGLQWLALKTKYKFNSIGSIKYFVKRYAPEEWSGIKKKIEIMAISDELLKKIRNDKGSGYSWNALARKYKFRNGAELSRAISLKNPEFLEELRKNCEEYSHELNLSREAIRLRYEGNSWKTIAESKSMSVSTLVQIVKTAAPLQYIDVIGVGRYSVKKGGK